MLDSIHEEEEYDATSYILATLNIIKDLWKMTVWIGKIDRPSSWDKIIRRAHLEASDDESFFTNIRTRLEFHIIIYFTGDYVICMVRPAMGPSIAFKLSFITSNLEEMENTYIDINIYITEGAQHLSHSDFLSQEHLLHQLPIELATTLRTHIPQEYLQYDHQCHRCQHLFQLGFGDELTQKLDIAIDQNNRHHQSTLQHHCRPREGEHVSERTTF